MDRETIYSITCRTCKVTYESRIPAIVGQPCPNPNCPKDNGIVGQVWWEHKWVKTTAAVAGTGLLVFLITNIGGWGAFILDLTLSFLVQAVLALILFGILLGVLLVAFTKTLKPLFSRTMLLGLFLLAAILVIPLVAAIFHRKFDVYDAASAVVISIVANVLSKPFERIVERR